MKTHHKILSLISGAVLSLATLSFTSLSLVKNSHNHQYQSQARAIVPLPLGDTPKNLYTIPVIPSPISNGTDLQAGRIIDGFKNLDLYSDEMKSLYQNKLRDVIVAISRPNDEDYVEVGKRAEIQFTDKNEILKAFNVLNQFKPIQDKTQPLKIKLPQKVTDIFAASNSGGSQEITIPNNFMYKVSEIDLEKLPDNQNLIFEFKDFNDPNVNNHDYNLVLSNANNRLKDLAKDPNDFTLEQLANINVLFVRDDSSENVYDFQGQNQNLQKISDIFYINKEPESSKLNVMIKPKSFDKAIQFNLSKKTNGPALDAVRYGILDNSLSPIYTKAITSASATTYPFLNDPLDPNSPFYDPTNVVKDYNVALISSNWKQEQNFPVGTVSMDVGEHLRFFLAPGVDWNDNLKFNNKGSDVFDGQDNGLQVNFTSANNVEVNPQKYAINQQDYIESPKTPTPLSVSTNLHQTKVNNQDVNWLQVDIVLQKGVLQINPAIPPLEELNYVIKSMQDRIFFEVPNGVTPIDNIVENGQKVILLEPKTDIVDLYKHMIGYVYANWSKALDTSDQFYIHPNQTWFPDDKEGNQGFSTYPIQYESYYEDKDGAIINKNKIYNQLIDEDINTGKDLLDSKGNPIVLPSTGVNIVTRLISSTNRYVKWLEQKFGITEGVRDYDFYLMTSASEKIAFVDKKIVNSSGKEGQKLKNVADAIVRYWSGASLTEEYQDLIVDLKNLITEKELPWNLETDVKDRNKPQSDGQLVDVSTPEYKKSLQIVMHLISFYLNEAVNVLFKVEKEQFDTFKASVLSKYMGEYLATNRDDAIGINDDVLLGFPKGELPPLLRDMNLFYANKTELIKTKNGSEELETILDFINKNKLYARYLNDLETEQFKEWFLEGKGDILKPESYQNAESAQIARSMIQLLDKILTQIIDSQVRLLGKIIDDIVAGKVESADYANEIRKVVRDAIVAIVDNEGEYIYEYFGIKATSTYIENLTVGRNIESALNKYLQLHPNLPEAQKQIIYEKLGNAAYDVNNITQLGVNLGYHNLEFFIKGLTQKETIVPIIEDILNSDLVRNLTLNIPDGSEFIRALNNSSFVAKISILIAGSLISLIAMIAISLTLRKNIRLSLQGKMLITTRVLFTILIVVSLIMIIFGIFIPIT